MSNQLHDVRENGVWAGIHGYTSVPKVGQRCGCTGQSKVVPGALSDWDSGTRADRNELPQNSPHIILENIAKRITAQNTN